MNSCNEEGVRDRFQFDS
eukprot:gene26785-biopygen17347